MQVTTTGGMRISDTAAFASFVNNTLTVDFKALGDVHNRLQRMAITYSDILQRCEAAGRSAQGEVTRCNNEVARLNERIDFLTIRIEELEDARAIREGVQPRRRWWQRG